MSLSAARNVTISYYHILNLVDKKPGNIFSRPLNILALKSTVPARLLRVQMRATIRFTLSLFVTAALWTAFWIWFYATPISDCPACWPPSLAYPQLYGTLAEDCFFILGGLLLYTRLLVLRLRTTALFLVGIVLVIVGIFIGGYSMCSNNGVYAPYCPPSAATVVLWEVAAALIGLGMFDAISLKSLREWLTHHPKINRLITPARLRVFLTVIIVVLVFARVFTFYFG